MFKCQPCVVAFGACARRPRSVALALPHPCHPPAPKRTPPRCALPPPHLRARAPGTEYNGSKGLVPPPRHPLLPSHSRVTSHDCNPIAIGAGLLTLHDCNWSRPPGASRGAVRPRRAPRGARGAGRRRLLAAQRRAGGPDPRLCALLHPGTPPPPGPSPYASPYSSPSCTPPRLCALLHPGAARTGPFEPLTFEPL